METLKFQSLIQKITGRDFIIDTADTEIKHEKEYKVYRVLPITGRTVVFYWKTAKSDERLLRSFITAFCNKYREPNPAAYDYSARTYGDSALWINKTPQEREYAYMHHSSNMYSKTQLMEQVQANFSAPEMRETLLKYGFYTTEYGIGIFCFWQTEAVVNAVNAMKGYLQAKAIPYKNEFSDARWVFRFKLNLSKELHNQILNSFN